MEVNQNDINKSSKGNFGGFLKSLGGALFSDSLSSALDFAYNRLTANAQMSDQKELMAYQYGLQKDFWNEQNAYNSPSAQIARLKQAGLNPAMLNGNAVNNTAGELSSVGGTSAPVGGSTRNSNVPLYMNALTNMLNADKERGLMSAQTRKLAEEVLNIKLERDIKEIALSMGITEAEVKKLEKNALYEAYYGESIDGGPLTIKNNPYKIQMDEHRAQIEKHKADASLSTALGITEDTLRDLRANNLGVSTEELRARSNNLLESSKNLLESTKAMSRENAIQAYNQEISRFFQMPDITILPEELQAKAAEYYADFVNGKYTYESTLHALYQQIDRYVEKNGHITRSHSYSHSMSAGNKFLSGLKTTSESITY